MILIYHILSTLIFFLALPVFPLVYLLSEKRRANLFQRLGILTGFKRKKNRGISDMGPCPVRGGG